MISIADAYISDILPDSIKSEKEVVALGYAIRNAVNKMIDYSKNTDIFSSIDILPEKILDILAIELRTQYYDESLEISQKRALIKNTIKWYHKAGTKSAVQEMIDKVFETGIILEWFNTGGDPGTFKISTTKPITQNLINEYNKLVINVKNMRSHLSGIVLGNKAEIIHYAGVAAAAHSVLSVKITL